MRAPQARFPAAPLLDHVRWAVLKRTGDSDPLPHVLARHAGVSTRSWYRWVKSGELTLSQADSVAVHLGVHPCAIWPDEWFVEVA